MSQKHTPGPWHMGEGNGEGSIFKTGEGRMRLEQPGGTTLYPICAMVRGWNDQEDEANARLIAAAPEMLDALHGMWAFASALVEKHGMDGDDTLTDEEHAIWQDVAGATNHVIAKASGGKP